MLLHHLPIIYNVLHFCPQKAHYSPPVAIFEFKMIITCQVASMSPSCDEPEVVQGMSVSLRCLDTPSLQFQGWTDDMGRISEWFPMGNGPAYSEGLPGYVYTVNNSSWRVHFSVAPYLPKEAPFPDIRIDFYVHQRSQHDIQLLLCEDQYTISDEIRSATYIRNGNDNSTIGAYKYADKEDSYYINSHQQTDCQSSLSVLKTPSIPKNVSVPLPASQSPSMSLQNILNCDDTMPTTEALNGRTLAWPSELIPDPSEELTPSKENTAPVEHHQPDTGKLKRCNQKRRIAEVSESIDLPENSSSRPTKHGRIEGVVTRRSLRLEKKREG